MGGLKSLLGSCSSEGRTGFYTDMEPQLLIDAKFKGINVLAERGKLLGARVAVYNETGDGAVLDCTEMQLQTGGDGIPARPLYRNPMTIEPRHLVILCTNHMPQLANAAITATVERTMVVRFPVTFRQLQAGEEETPTVRQCDTSLKDRLASPEGQAALFSWLVEGAVAWYGSKADGGLKRSAPAKVREFTRKYLEDQDRVAVFLRDHCEFGPDKRTLAVWTYRQFLTLLGARANAKVHSKSWFDRVLTDEKGFQKKKMRFPGYAAPQWGYDGLSVKEPEEDAECALLDDPN